MDKEKIQNLTVLAGLALGGYFLYKLSKGSSVKKAVKETIEEPTKIIKDVSNEVMKVSKTGLKYFAKGSKEAKEHMAKLRAKRKPKSKKTESYKNGGTVKKTGLALVHKGEIVIPNDGSITDVKPDDTKTFYLSKDKYYLTVFSDDSKSYTARILQKSTDYKKRDHKFIWSDKFANFESAVEKGKKKLESLIG